jgi:LemA protein
MKYNNMQQVFPSNIIAGMFGFKPREYFEIGEAAAKAPVKVSF